jgi:fructosamine-3-kinase
MSPDSPDLPAPVRRWEHLGGGAAGAVRLAHLVDGRSLVVKTAAGGLDVEARMLALLRGRTPLPVPGVHHASPTVLVMDLMPGTPGAAPGAHAHAADLLAATHALTSPDGAFGLTEGGTIGPLPQPNTPAPRWDEFFRDRRLLHFAHAAARENAITPALLARLERLAARLGELVPPSPPASLIHGDLWSGNILSAGDRITGVIDPAPYYAHAEVELAFIRLFSSLSRAFFDRYWDLSGTPAHARREFDARRCDLYNLYPLLVHARLFGGHYAGEVASNLSRLGF